MSKCNCVAVSWLIAGIICLLLFVAIGASVGPDGVLHEPFFLLPVGTVLSLLGAGGLLVCPAIAATRRAIARARQSKR
jgi:hypothetical protein